MYFGDIVFILFCCLLATILVAGFLENDIKRKFREIRNAVILRRIYRKQYPGFQIPKEKWWERFI